MWRRVLRIGALLIATGGVESACQCSESAIPRPAPADAGTKEASRDVDRPDASSDTGHGNAMTDAGHRDARDGGRVDAEAGDARTNDSGIPELDPACMSCLEQNCDIPLRACRPDPGCRALLGCLAAPTSACRKAFTCTAAAKDRSEVVACVSNIAGDGGAFDYFAAVNVCAVACNSVCPPPPLEAETISTCRSAFEQNYPTLATSCRATEECLCERCPLVLRDCFAESDCTQLLSCDVSSGCTGLECYACPYMRTAAAMAAEDCLTKQCEPCKPTDAGP